MTHKDDVVDFAFSDRNVLLSHTVVHWTVGVTCEIETCMSLSQKHRNHKRRGCMCENTHHLPKQSLAFESTHAERSYAYTRLVFVLVQSFPWKCLTSVNHAGEVHHGKYGSVLWSIGPSFLQLTKLVDEVVKRPRFRNPDR